MEIQNSSMDSLSQEEKSNMVDSQSTIKVSVQPSTLSTSKDPVLLNSNGRCSVCAAIISQGSLCVNCPAPSNYNQQSTDDSFHRPTLKASDTQKQSFINTTGHQQQKVRPNKSSILPLHFTHDSSGPSSKISNLGLKLLSGAISRMKQLTHLKLILLGSDTLIYSAINETDLITSNITNVY